MLTGAPKNSLVNDFLQAVCVSSGDAAGSSPAKALTAISHAVKAGVDMKVFLELVLEKARAALLLRATGGAPIFPLDETFGEEDATFLKSLATHPSTTLSASLLAELLRAYDDVSRGSGGGIQSLPLELAVIRLAEVGVAR
jgi:hypothetical protein